ncbi:MAG: biotin--[acetyl-CoA-carboxylase] ligase [Verrucomicrobia bacterium]|nr:biotin--[acetyl-CoA-carboxylase] ligase [Verrucomicrobiota bacterium]
MSPASPLSEKSCRSIDGWQVHEFATLPSTNPIAGALPPWHAVRADVQTGGRGRTGRVWVSDAGGLWLSAVLPAPGPRKKWSILPLGAGWAVIDALREIGITGLRLRWPNDILAGRRKLAGLLVEQYQPETAVIGVGINIANRPDSLEASLVGHTIGVEELAGRAVTLDEITRLTLGAFRRLQNLIEQDRFNEIVTDINTRWGEARRVQLSLNSRPEPLAGYFRGVDPEGRLSFTDDLGTAHTLDASQVALLREV